MYLKMIVYGAILISLSLLSACSAFRSFVDPDWSLTGQDRVTQAGVIQNMDPNLEKVDLIKLLDPAYTPTKTGGASTGSALSVKPSFISDEEGKALTELYAAYQRFDESGRGPEGRNQIQDEILRASEQRCNVYKTYIRRTQSTSNFLFGSLATLLGGLGAIFTDATVARSLAGSAGIVSGINAEYQQAYFSNLATEVIVDGIETRRRRIRSEIVVMQQNYDLTTYTVQAAILDAVRFHGACTIVEGLREASQSIQTVRDPGLKAIKSSLRDIAEARKMLDQIQKGEELSSLSAGLTAADSGSQAALNTVGSSFPIFEVYSGSMNSPVIAISQARAGALRYKGSLIKAIAGKKTEFTEDSAVPKTVAAEANAALDALQKEIESAHGRLSCKFTGYEQCEAQKPISPKLAEAVGKLQATADLTKRAEIQKEIVKLQYLAKYQILIDLADTSKQFRNLLKVSQDGLSLLKPGDATPKKSVDEIKKKITEFMKEVPDGTDEKKCTSSCPDKQPVSKPGEAKGGATGPA
jgi:hypothetical protein